MVFAKNLRRLCAVKSNIATVCEDLAINRQQFNKYLNGMNVPGKKILNKIAAYFEVSPSDFFVEHVEKIDLKIYEVISRILSRGQAHILKDGFYFCYYPLAFDPQYFVRALIIVKNEGGVTRFTRVNIVRSYRDQKLSVSERYVGIVQSIDKVLHFSDVSENEPRDINLAKFEPLFPGGQDLFVGITLMRVPLAPFPTIAIRSALAVAPPQTLLSALKQCGVFKYEGSGLHDHILQAVQNIPFDKTAALDMFSIYRDLRH